MTTWILCWKVYMLVTRLASDKRVRKERVIWIINVDVEISGD